MCSRSLRNGCAKPSSSPYTKSENALKAVRQFARRPPRYFRFLTGFTVRSVGSPRAE